MRIFPLYYAYLALIFLVLLPLTSSWASIGDPSDYTASWYVLYAQNWKQNRGVGEYLLSHFWSLAVEEQFYIVWPWMVYFMPRRPIAWFNATIALGALILRIVMYMNGADFETIHRITPCRLDTLMTGAYLPSRFVAQYGNLEQPVGQEQSLRFHC